MVPLHVGNLVHGDVAREGHREVVAQGEDLAALGGNSIEKVLA